jgi:hypothetical protein
MIARMNALPDGSYRFVKNGSKYSVTPVEEAS